MRGRLGEQEERMEGDLGLVCKKILLKKLRNKGQKRKEKGVLRPLPEASISHIPSVEK